MRKKDLKVSRQRNLRSIAFFVSREIALPLSLREYYVSRELKKRGWNVSWLLPKFWKNNGLKIRWPIKAYPELNIRGRKVIFPFYLAIKLRLSSVNLIWISGWAIRSPKELFWLVIILKIAKIRVIYDPIDPIDLYIAAQEEDELNEHEGYSRFMTRIYQLCDAIFCVTPEIRELFIKKGISKEKVFVARWGTDMSTFNELNVDNSFRKRLGLNKDTFLVGWLGSMSRFKGLNEIMLPLISRLSPKLKDIHFIIAGGGLLENDIKRWIQKNRRLPVTLRGRIPYEQAPSFTWSLDAYLIPTNPISQFARSICPVKCFDALMMGTDVITTQTDATNFLCDLSSKVKLCDFNIECFENALMTLYQQRSLDKILPKISDVYQFTHQCISIQICETLEKLFDSS